MSKNKKCVTDFGGIGIPMQSRKTLPLGEDLQIGTLVGIKDGKLVKATNDSSTPIRAVTVITRGSLPGLNTPRYYTGNEKEATILKKGEFHELYPAFVIQNVPSDEVDFTTAEYGQTVYLGVDGKLTTVKPTTSGELIQIVGYVGDPIREEVICQPMINEITKAI